MNPRPFPWLLLVAGSLCLASVPATAGEEGPAGLRERANRLEEKVRALKADGRAEEAEKLNLEVRELRNLARKEGAPAPGDERLSERRRLKEQLAGTRQKLEEAKGAGREAEAREFAQLLDKLERRLDELNRGPGPGPGEARPGMRRDAPPGDGAPGVGRQRLEHLKIAIEHLHAAGLHPAAERLALQAEQMARRLQQAQDEPRREGPRPGPGPGARRQQDSPGDVGQLRAELDELRRAVRDLERRLGESQHDRH